MTKAIVPINHDGLERVVDSLSIKETKEFMILTPAKVVALVPIETPSRPRFVIEIALGQGITRSGRCYTLEELSHRGKKKDQRKRPISEGKAKDF